MTMTPADPMPFILTTERLRLRRLDAVDAPFIVELVNDPSWVRFIGDKGVRTDEDAERYIRTGPVAMYARVGFGLWLVELRESEEPIGICGLIRRQELADVDLGFAFLPRFRRQGYAMEAARAVLSYATDVLRLPRVVAICSADNHASTRLLAKLGFVREGTVRLGANGEPVELYAAA